MLFWLKEPSRGHTTWHAWETHGSQLRGLSSLNMLETNRTISYIGPSTDHVQGCQIFLGTIYQISIKYTKWPKNIPNHPNLYQTTHQYTKRPKNIPNDPKIYQTTPKYTKRPQSVPNGYNVYQHLLHSARPSKIYPKSGFLVRKYAIWQPRSRTAWSR
jgi:hypothetical protein